MTERHDEQDDAHAIAEEAEQSRGGEDSRCRRPTPSISPPSREWRRG
jgi:hypothetical protein